MAVSSVSLKNGIVTQVFRATWFSVHIFNRDLDWFLHISLPFLVLLFPSLYAHRFHPTSPIGSSTLPNHSINNLQAVLTNKNVIYLSAYISLKYTCRSFNFSDATILETLAHALPILCHLQTKFTVSLCCLLADKMNPIIQDVPSLPYSDRPASISALLKPGLLCIVRLWALPVLFWLHHYQQKIYKQVSMASDKNKWKSSREI